MTCDVTPHHLALTDEWLAGSRRWAWAALATTARPATRGATARSSAAPYDASLRVNPPLRRAGGRPRLPRRRCVDGTVDAVATDHAPHTEVDKDVEFGLARPGSRASRRRSGSLLEAVDAGLADAGRAIEALTIGPGGVLGDAGGAVPASS